MARPHLNFNVSQVAAEKTNESERDQAKLTEFEIELIAVFVDLVQTLGLPKSYGEIYGLLYATPRPLGFAEIHERLTLSKGSVSGGIKALRGFGAVRTVLDSETRREVYLPEIESRKLIANYLVERIQPQIVRNGQRVLQLEQLFSDVLVSSSEKKLLTLRLEKLGKWRRRAAGLIPWVTRFLSD